MPASDQIKSALPDDAVGQAGINQLRAWPYFTALHLIFFVPSSLFGFLRTKRQEALNHLLVENLAQCLNKDFVSCITSRNLRKKQRGETRSYIEFLSFAY